MEQGRIIIITGSPGTGKSTISQIIAKESPYERSVHMHTDDFYHHLCKGAVPPHRQEANEQNGIVMKAFREAAKCYVQAGYDVIIDGIVGPWFIEAWEEMADAGYEIHYIILRADQKETLRRASERQKLDRETNRELVETMWEQFHGLGVYERFVLDTTGEAVEKSVLAVQEKVRKKENLL